MNSDKRIQKVNFGKTAFLLVIDQDLFHKILRFLDIKSCINIRLVCQKINSQTIIYLANMQKELQIRHQLLTSDIQKLTMQTQKSLQFPDINQQIKQLTKSDLAQVWCLKVAPPAILKVISLLTLIVLGNTNKDPWELGKQMLQSPEFLSRLLAFDKEKMSEFQKSQVKKITEINLKDVQMTSLVCGAFYKWIDGLRQIIENPSYKLKIQLSCCQREAKQIQIQIFGINKIGKQLKV